MRREIKVIIAADEAIPRSALRLLVGTAPAFVVVGECDLANARYQVEERRPDIALLHSASPNGATLATIKSVATSTRVGILTRQRHPAYVRSCLAAGARGYLLMSGDPADLFSGLRLVVHGHRYIDASLHDMMIEVLARSGQERSEVLSGRECQVLKMLAYGFTNQQIAEALSISRKSVDTYRHRIATKLQLRDRSEIVKYALATGLLTADNPNSDDDFPLSIAGD